MKNNIIKLIRRLPILYTFIKKIYKASPYYKKIASESKKKSDQKIQMMSKIFLNNFIVHNGPFKGLLYIKESNGSAHLPKVLGSYEEPIQDWISDVIKKNYKTIIDIGCAEGYYAVGFGMKMPNTKIIAYDVDEKAIKNINNLIILNKQKNIEVRSECTHEELNNECKKNTLVFCDIEGYEDVLLDPSKVPNLSKVDIIVESHDFLVPNLTEKLISRFYKTHSIKIVIDYPFRKNSYNTPVQTNDQEFALIMDEERPAAMKFLLLETKNV